MSIILNIESATDVCSVCLSKDNEILGLTEVLEPFKHSEKLTLLIQECLKKAHLTLRDLTAVSISSGPGSYTSLRVGTSVAKGICYALDIPLISVPTLKALAYGARIHVPEPDSLIVPMIDARRMEVYTAIYDDALNEILPTQAKIIDEYAFSDFLNQDKKLIFCGNGSEKCEPVIKHSNALFFPNRCASSFLIHLASTKLTRKEFVNLAYFEPYYFKSPNITTPKKIL